VSAGPGGRRKQTKLTNRKSGKKGVEKKPATDFQVREGAMDCENRTKENAGVNATAPTIGAGTSTSTSRKKENRRSLIWHASRGECPLGVRRGRTEGGGGGIKQGNMKTAETFTCNKFRRKGAKNRKLAGKGGKKLSAGYKRKRRREIARVELIWGNNYLGACRAAVKCKQTKGTSQGEPGGGKERRKTHVDGLKRRDEE